MMQTTIAGVTFLMMAGTSRGPDIDPDNAFCRICQCTDDHACEGGCCWVTDPAAAETGPYTDTDPLNPAVAIARVPPDAA